MREVAGNFMFRGTCAPAGPRPANTRFARLVADAGLALNVASR